jgi:hypothetical protein
MINALEDMEDKRLVEERRASPFLEVTLDEL